MQIRKVYGMVDGCEVYFGAGRHCWASQQWHRAELNGKPMGSLLVGLLLLV
jgi:hypothetical protein